MQKILSGKSQALQQKLQSFADKITGTTRINNLTDPNSAAYKRNRLNINNRPPQSFKAKPTSNGVGVGP